VIASLALGLDGQLKRLAGRLLGNLDEALLELVADGSALFRAV